MGEWVGEATAWRAGFLDQGLRGQHRCQLFFFSFGLLEERQLREPIGVSSTNFWKTLDAQLARRPRAEIPRLPVSTVWH